MELSTIGTTENYNYNFHYVPEMKKSEPVTVESLAYLQCESPKEWKSKIIELLDQGKRIRVKSLVEHSNAVMDMSADKKEVSKNITDGQVGELTAIKEPAAGYGYSAEIDWGGSRLMFYTDRNVGYILSNSELPDNSGASGLEKLFEVVKIM